MLQNLTSNKNKRSGHNGKSSESRRRFLVAYEKTFGNVSASCSYAGISRQTFYRWVKGNSKDERWFRRRVESIRPKELLLDVAEHALFKLIDEGNVQAAIYCLKTRGKDRGWGTKLPVKQPAPTKEEVLDRVTRAFREWEKQTPNMVPPYRAESIRRFAEAGGVEYLDLLDRVGMWQQ